MKIFTPLCIVLLFYSTSLAQSQAASGREVGWVSLFHLNNPPTAQEYVFSLNDYATQESYSLWSNYFDFWFMVDAGNEQWAGPNTCIVRSSPRAEHYTYSVIPGHEDDIIEGVQSEQARRDFYAWRGNPNWQQICNYLTYRFQRNDTAAAAIKEECCNNIRNFWGSYPLMQNRNNNGVVDIAVVTEDDCIQFFNQADQVVRDVQQGVVATTLTSVLAVETVSPGVHYKWYGIRITPAAKNCVAQIQLPDEIGYNPRNRPRVRELLQCNTPSDCFSYHEVDDGMDVSGAITLS